MDYTLNVSRFGVYHTNTTLIAAGVGQTYSEDSFFASVILMVKIKISEDITHHNQEFGGETWHEKWTQRTTSFVNQKMTQIWKYSR